MGHLLVFIGAEGGIYAAPARAIVRGTAELALDAGWTSIVLGAGATFR